MNDEFQVLPASLQDKMAPSTHWISAWTPRKEPCCPDKERPSHVVGTAAKCYIPPHQEISW